MSLVVASEGDGAGQGQRLAGAGGARLSGPAGRGALPAAAMAPWLPASAEDSGSPIEARSGNLTVRACTAAGPLSNRNTFSCSHKITAQTRSMAMTITAMYVPCEVIAERCLQEIDTNSDAGMANTPTSWLRVETTVASKWTRARV